MVHGGQPITTSGFELACAMPILYKTLTEMPMVTSFCIHSRSHPPDDVGTTQVGDIKRVQVFLRKVDHVRVGERAGGQQSVCQGRKERGQLRLHDVHAGLLQSIRAKVAQHWKR
jgi:hypothetical protein